MYIRAEYIFLIVVPLPPATKILLLSTTTAHWAPTGYGTGSWRRKVTPSWVLRKLERTSDVE